jgi:hypothetical protein
MLALCSGGAEHVGGHRLVNSGQPVNLSLRPLNEHVDADGVAPVVLLRGGERPPPCRFRMHGVVQTLNLDQVAQRCPAEQAAVGLEPTDPLGEPKRRTQQQVRTNPARRINSRSEFKSSSTSVTTWRSSSA